MRQIRVTHDSIVRRLVPALASGESHRAT